MKIYHTVAAVALLAVAGVAQAQVGGVPATGIGTPPGTIGSPSAAVNGGVGVNAAGDRARTGRDAIGSTPGTTATTTGTVTGATPPIATTPGSSMGGVTGEAGSGTAATSLGMPPR